MESPASSQKRSVAQITVAAGDVVAGKFRVSRIVGRGGMGVVVEATNIQLDQRVALKLLLGGASDAAIVERFTGEARAAARLRSEHVARVHDVGSDPTHGPFMVMELLEGRTLAELVATSGPVPVHRAIEYIIDACEGLAEAHARGIVHQDVKPGNLFLVTGGDGRPAIKVLDFGIAAMRLRGQKSDAKSSGPALGTPAYLAPEQLRATSQVDHRTDVWALGCVLYELLAARRAFPATRFTELVTMILEAPPAPLPAELDAPPAILDALFRCLEKDPARRFASTGALALALLPFARRRAHGAVAKAVAHAKSGGIDPGLEMPSSMPPPPTVDSQTDLPSSAHLRAPRTPSDVGKASGIVPRDANVAATASSVTPTERLRHSRAAVLFLAAAILGVLGALALWRLTSGPSPTTAPPPPSASSANMPASSSTMPSAVTGASSTPSTSSASPPPPSAASSVGREASGVGASPSARPSSTPFTGRAPSPSTPPRPTKPAGSPPNAPPTPTDSDIHHAR